MPKVTETISYCPRCGKKTCDGGVWRYVKIVEYCYTSDSQYRRTYTGKEKVINLKTIPEENMELCTGDAGVSRRKFLKGKKVGDQVRLEFDNWADPSWVIVEKVED